MQNKNLLIITQKVDKDDDLLGFFHGWIKELSAHCKKITVIALGVGEYDFLENVKVFSLGKFPSREGCPQRGGVCYHIRTKLKYTYNFYKYIWQERKNYDSVFVHMNKENVVLGGLFWKFTGKNIMLWYNHIYGSVLARLAGLWTDQIFYTSEFSFFAKWQKAKQMPVGVDTEYFKPDSNIHPEANSILCLGRISPVKNLDIMLEAAKILDEQNINFVLHIAGSAPDRDRDYFEKLKDQARSLVTKGKIKFLGKIPFSQTRELYNLNRIFVNLTNSGSLDKTIIEAMACGCVPIISNANYAGKLSSENIFEERDAKDLARKLKNILANESVSEDYTDSARSLLAENSLKNLVNKLIEI